MTPRATRLVRAENLPALHRALLSLAARGSLADVRRRVILLPSRAAAQQLRHTLEAQWFEIQPTGRDSALVLPDLLTRDDWYRRLHDAGGFPEPLLTALEREVLLAAAAREAIAGGLAPPFRLRPGLLAEMLDLYDALAGQRRTIDTFERIVTGELEPRLEVDRGAERLLRQTRFLVAAFRSFERRVAASGKLDEHALRRRLLDPTSDPVAHAHVVVAVGDRAAEPAGGLFPADYELMVRMPGVEAIHLVATRQQLAAGLAERLHDLIPGLQEVDADAAGSAPRLLAPEGDGEPPYRASRDREEELRAVARWIKHDARLGEPTPLDRVAVVFRRPLPYIYLARTVFDAAGVEHQAADALPLASEPMAALLDLVVAAVESRFSRSALVALLRSPHLGLSATGDRLEPEDVDAFDRRLAEGGYLGGPDALARQAGEWKGPGGEAARAAAETAARLRPLVETRAVSAHAASLLDFLRAHERIDVPDEAVRARHLRARAAVHGALEQLRRASLEFDDPPATLSDVASSVRRWIESQTFSPRVGTGGVQLADAQAARFGTFDTVFLVGLAEGDWPEPSSRNIFYPSFLLAELGWPSERARVSAARAAFLDLLRVARERTRVSTFTLEDDSIVNPSPLLDELAHAGLTIERRAEPRMLVFEDEALTARPVPAEALGGEVRRWLDRRLARTPAAEPRFHGAAGPGRRRPHSVTSIDQFLQCPFKFFAGRVLGLPEELEDEPSRSPRAEGQFVHEVLCAFFQSWQAAGGGTITPDALDTARAHFARVAGERLAALPPADAGLARQRLLGSVGAPGLGEIVLAAEAARPDRVRERLLEYALEGEFEMAGAGASRRVRLRGKVDRVDLLEDGRFRLIDYKNGKLPEAAQTIQLPIYAACVQQQLARTGKGRWVLAEAGYLAFGDARPDRVVIGGDADAARKMAEGQQRLLDAIDRIERGEFPPRPASPRLCGTCAYAAVCRKDFVDGD